MKPLTGADIRPAKCGHYVPIRPGRGLQPQRCPRCKATDKARDRFEWECREKDCHASGVCETPTLAFAEWDWHDRLAHPRKARRRCQ